MGAKELIEQTGGKWLVEIAELKGHSDRDIEHNKVLMRRTIDKARLAYDKYSTEAARRYVMFGTTNETNYLRDPTGNRTYWPVRANKRADIKWLLEHRDQLWAEAYARAMAGEDITLDPSLYAAATAGQAERFQSTRYQLRLDKVLQDIEGKIASVDVWDIVEPRSFAGHGKDRMLGDAMRALGWQWAERRGWQSRKKPTPCYFKGDDSKWIELVWETNEVTGQRVEVTDVHRIGENGPGLKAAEEAMARLVAKADADPFGQVVSFDPKRSKCK
jgi:hypothetical protein